MLMPRGRPNRTLGGFDRCQLDSIGIFPQLNPINFEWINGEGTGSFQESQRPANEMNWTRHVTAAGG